MSPTECTVVLGDFMAKIVMTIAAALIAVASPGLAADKCAPREVGSFPWANNGLVNGDLYGWVYLKIDKNGRPQCFMGQNNINDSDQRFFICQAFTRDWKPAKPEDALPGAVVKRLFIMAGPHHDKIEKEARRRFFADHPDERPECYPEG